MTWGKIQRIAPSFIQKYMDEGLTYLDTEIINKAGLAPGAYDHATLEKMLAKVSPQPVIKSLEEIAAEEQAANEVIRYSFASVDTTPHPTAAQFDVAFKTLRAALDGSGYGWALTDAKLRPYSDAVAIGVVRATPKQEKAS